ncbi:16345_t:CDS:1, partial [Gigaspora margarita]
TCTITDISSETVISTITCSTETPTLSTCPNNEQDCDKCEQTTTVTCTPTTTICAAPTCAPNGDPCNFGNPEACCNRACYNFGLPSPPLPTC